MNNEKNEDQYITMDVRQAVRAAMARRWHISDPCEIPEGTPRGSAERVGELLDMWELQDGGRWWIDGSCAVRFSQE